MINQAITFNYNIVEANGAINRVALISDMIGLNVGTNTYSWKEFQIGANPVTLGSFNELLFIRCDNPLNLEINFALTVTINQAFLTTSAGSAILSNSNTNTIVNVIALSF